MTNDDIVQKLWNLSDLLTAHWRVTHARLRTTRSSAKPLPTSPLQRGRSNERQAKGDGKPGKVRQVKAYRVAG